MYIERAAVCGKVRRDVERGVLLYIKIVAMCIKARHHYGTSGYSTLVTKQT